MTPHKSMRSYSAPLVLTNLSETVVRFLTLLDPGFEHFVVGLQFLLQLQLVAECLSKLIVLLLQIRQSSRCAPIIEAQNHDHYHQTCQLGRMTMKSTLLAGYENLGKMTFSF